MIALVAIAEAAPYHVDVLALPATLRTGVFQGFSDSLDVNGRTITTPLPEARPGLGSRGFQLELGRCWDKDAEWIAAFGYRQENPDYDLGLWAFEPAAYELKVQVGFMAFASTKPVPPPVDLYVAGYTGLQLSTFAVAPFDPPAVTPGWASALSVGVANRKGPLRVRVEGRLDVVPRFDQFSGTAQLIESAFRWEYTPGGAAASVLVGVGYASPGRRDEASPSGAPL